MKHLKKYNEAKKSKKSQTKLNEISESDVKDYFLETSDLSRKFELKEIYFGEWLDEPQLDRDYELEEYEESHKGFMITIEHNFFDRSELNDFLKYSELINQLTEDIIRFKEVFNPQDIFFDEPSDDEIKILINPHK